MQSNNTYYSFTTDRTLSVANQIHEETTKLTKELSTTRQNTEDLMAETAVVKTGIQGLGQDVNQIGRTVAEMFSLLQRIDRQKSLPFEGYGGFVPHYLFDSLERYMSAESGIDSEELRTQFSSISHQDLEDDLRSVRSGWGWREPADVVTWSSRPATTRGAKSNAATNLQPQSQMAGLAALLASQSAELPTSDGTGARHFAPLPPSPPALAEDGRETLGADHTQENRADVTPSTQPRETPSESSDALHDIASNDFSNESSPATTSSKPGRPKAVCVSDNRPGRLEQVQRIWEDISPGDPTLGLIHITRSETSISEAERIRQSLRRREQRERNRRLHQISQNTNAGDLEQSLSKGGNPNLHSDQAKRFLESRTLNQAPPLYRAIEVKNLACIEILLRYGAHPDCYLEEVTPLERMIGEFDASPPSFRLVALLLGNGARVTEKSIYHAACKNDSRLMAMLLYCCAEPLALKQINLDRVLDGALDQHSHTVDAKVLQLLLSMGARSTESQIESCLDNAKQKTMRTSIQKELWEGVFSHLLDHRDTRVNLDRHLVTAFDTENPSAAVALISRGARLPEGDPHFHGAIKLGRLDMFERLLVGIKPSISDLNGYLRTAVYHVLPNIAIIEMLLAMGAEPLSSYVDHAIVRSHLPLFGSLLETGSKPNLSRIDLSVVTSEMANRLLLLYRQDLPIRSKRTRLEFELQERLASSYNPRKKIPTRFDPVVRSTISMLLEDGAKPNGDTLSKIFLGDKPDNELIALLLQNSIELGRELWLAMIESTSSKVIELVLSADAGIPEVSELLEKSLEAKARLKGQNPGFKPSWSSHPPKDSLTPHDRLRAAESICGLLFSAWVRQKPTSLGPRSMEFLVSGNPEETQFQIVARCSHHPTTDTLTFLLQYAARARTPVLRLCALKGCVEMLDSNTDLESSTNGAGGSWANLLAASIAIFSASPNSYPSKRAKQLMYRCFELVLQLMEERGRNVNEDLPLGVVGVLDIVFEKSTPETSPKLLHLLRKYGANLNQAEPWRLAVRNRHFDSFEVLLGAKKMRPIDLLHYAVQNFMTEDIRVILEHGPVVRALRSLDSTCGTPAHRPLAAYAKDDETLNILFDAGLEFGIDEDLETLREIAEQADGERPPRWPSGLFITWWQAQPEAARTSQSSTDATNCSNIEPWTESILLHAAGENKPYLLSRLLKRGKKSDGLVQRHRSTEYILQQVLSWHNLEILQLVLNAGIPCDLESTWRLLLLQGGRENEVRLLWESRREAVAHAAEYCFGLLTQTFDDRNQNNKAAPGESGKRGSTSVTLDMKLINTCVLVFMLDIADELASTTTEKLYRYRFCGGLLDTFEPKDLALIMVAYFRLISRRDRHSREPKLPGLQYYTLFRRQKSVFLQRDLPRTIFGKGALLIFAARNLRCDEVSSELVGASPQDVGCISLGSDRPINMEDIEDLAYARRMVPGTNATRSLLYYAITGRNVHTVQRAIECGSDVNEWYGTTTIFPTPPDWGCPLNLFPGGSPTSGYGKSPMRKTIRRAIKGPGRERENFLNEHEIRKSEGPLKSPVKATLLHIAIFCCARADYRQGFMKSLAIIEELVKAGANVDTLAWIPRRFLRSDQDEIGQITNDPFGEELSVSLTPEEFGQTILLDERSLYGDGGIWAPKKIRKLICEALGRRMDTLTNLMAWR